MFALSKEERLMHFGARNSLLLTRSDVLAVWNNDVKGLVNAVKDAFIAYMEGEVILPPKSSQVFDDASQSRINCMPSTLLGSSLAGVKWVSVFPDNPAMRNMRNVGGVMVLSSIEDGQVVAVLDASALTALRTAAVDTLAARYLAKKRTNTVVLIGTGEQAAYHARFLAPPGSGVEVRIAGRNAKHADALERLLFDEGIVVSSFGDRMDEAVAGGDVIVTAISGQVPLLRADWITGGALYCHVGGWEDEYAVARKADMIVCDDWLSLKHRGSPTIARMYAEGQLRDEDIYANLGEIVTGKKEGRTSDSQFVYFNAIGLSFVDVAVASWVLNRAYARGVGVNFDFLA